MASDAFVSSPCGPLAVRDHGGAGPSVLLLHGSGHNLEVWNKVARSIDGQARVVAVDLRGHGWSANDVSFTLPDLAGDVRRVCAAMGLDSPVLVGHSLGGWVALAAAAAGVNTQCLITIEGPVISMETLFRRLGLTPDGGVGGGDALRARAFRGDDGAWLKRLTHAGPPGSVARAVATRAGRRGDDGLMYSYPSPDVLLAAQRCAWQIDPAVTYQQVHVPVTIMLGERLPSMPNPQRFNDLRTMALRSLLAIKGLDVKWLPGGHNLPAECPYAVADAILTATCR